MPVKTGERFLSIDYAIIRLMNTKTAYKTIQKPKGFLAIKHNKADAQLWLTLRVPVKDEWAQDYSGFLDVDIYIPNTGENRIKLKAWLNESDGGSR